MLNNPESVPGVNNAQCALILAQGGCHTKFHSLMAKIIRKTPVNLILIGFMATGKSTLARTLAPGLGFDVVDTDDLIIERAGKPITEIFSDIGQEGFRDLESGILKDFLNRDRMVISTGGGIVTRPGNIELLRSLGMVIWLNASIDVIIQRAAKSDGRPLLKADDPRRSVEELLAGRVELYREAADECIDVDDLSSEELAYGIAESARVWFARSH